MMRTFFTWLWFLLLVTACADISVRGKASDAGSSTTEDDTSPAAGDVSEEINLPILPPDLPPPTGDPCVDGVVLSALIDLIVDPDPVGCPWGEGSNLGEAQATITARDETLARPLRSDNGDAINWLEEGGQLCAVRLDSKSLDNNPIAADFVYDDVLFVTMNDVVLLASAAPILQYLEQVDGAYIYDWEQLRGNSMFFQQQQAYCMDHGEGGECGLPSSDTTGEFFLSFAGPQVDQLRQRILAEQTLALKFITMGDNDPDTDCRHNGFRMRVMLDIALPGSF